jgi:hypothetical protein
MQVRSGNNLSIYLIKLVYIIVKIEEKICTLMVFWNENVLNSMVKLLPSYLILILKQSNKLRYVIFGYISLSEIVSVN